MYLLHLTEKFSPFWGEGTEIQIMDNGFWTGGEVKFRLNPFGDARNCAFDDVVRITTRLNNGDDIMRLFMATAALREFGWERIELFIPYLPYARQDRICNAGEPHSLRIFADLINAHCYDRVLVLDPHSYVAEALIRRCEVINNHTFIEKVMEDHISQNGKEFVLIAPDAGAEKKIRAVSKVIAGNPKLKYAGTYYAQKVRNGDGDVIETRIDLGDGHLEDRVAVIVDDICDGGRSFYPLANELKKKHASAVVLAVTHGIFSFNFLNNYDSSGLDRVFTTNSIRNWNPNATTIKLEDLF